MFSVFASEKWLHSDLIKVETILANAVNSKEIMLKETGNRLVCSGGKRIRPAFVLLGAQFGQAPITQEVLKIAASVELMHMATLVHDDIIDESHLRRGQSTVQHSLGNDVAVFTGDFLLTKALLLLSEVDSNDRLADFAHAMIHICEGEVAQYADRNQHVSLKRYLKRIRGKTAALFSICLAGGAHQTKAHNYTCRLLSQFGLYFGIAFQIYDDILDYKAKVAEIGKPVGNDLRLGVYTLPLLMALQNEKYSSKLYKMLAQHPLPVNSLIELVVEAKGTVDARLCMLRYKSKAEKVLIRCPQNRGTRVLKHLLDNLLGV